MSQELPSFERLLELAKQDPRQLEAIRQQQVEELISRAPEHLQRRLRGLQFQIDCKRKLHQNPLSSCIAISQMMLNSLDELNDVLQAATGRTPAPKQAELLPRAKVIRFPVAARRG